ncbi:Arginase [Paramyrothecium foliicola]|nr:Arginase [Paramyrothecium foliicola]
MSRKVLQAVTVISSPYHVGFHNRGVGAGPNFIKSHGLLKSLRDLGVTVNEVEIEPVGEFEGEIGRSFELMRRVSTSVTEALDNGAFPLILSGNCSAAVGVAAGYTGSSHNLPERELGCVWFDAHDDYNNPDTVLSGYFDSQAIAMLGGECWKALLGTIPGHTAMSLREKLVHVGMRDVNDLERQRVLKAGFDVIWGKSEGRTNFAGELEQSLKGKDFGPTMLHLDVDSLDLSLGKANQFSAPGGLLEDDLRDCIDVVMQRTQPVSLTVASFDPFYHGAENIAAIAVRAITRLVSSLISAGALCRET